MQPGGRRGLHLSLENAISIAVLAVMGRDPHLDLKIRS